MSHSDGLRSRRFHDDVEGAAYFFISEALANVLKHAEASRAEVELTGNGEHLRLRVRDDGNGFDAAVVEGGGLEGLRDRVMALGGTVTVTSRVGGGSEITADIPVGQS